VVIPRLCAHFSPLPPDTPERKKDRWPVFLSQWTRGANIILEIIERMTFSRRNAMPRRPEDDDAFEEERPRSGSRRDDDDDDDDRPRRRRRDDDDDADDLPRIRKKPMSGLDGTFANTSLPILIIFGMCCSGIALILSIVGLATCHDPTARKNATIVLIISIVFVVIWNVVYCAGEGMHEFK
jgi:hypothetical protein